MTLRNKLGKPQTKRVSHLVLETFVGPRPDGTECCHFPDANPENNDVRNLRWATHIENIADRTISGNAPSGVRHGMARLTPEIVREIRKIREETGMTYIKIGELFGINRAHAGDIVNRVVWKDVD